MSNATGAVAIGDATEQAQALRAWLASGKLQSEHGAFCAWLDRRSDALAFEYPEINGYALTWFSGRDQATDQERIAGRHAANWLRARLEGGDRSARTGWNNGAVYTFDLGMIAAGLISFGAKYGTEEHVRLGRRTARRLAQMVCSEEGLVSIDPTGPATSRPPQWSTEGRPHLVKCVQALLLADELEAAQSLVATAADHVDEGERFRTQPEDACTMLHPHLYTVEGLWIWGSAQGDPDALDLARRATEWAWRHQLPSGGLPRYVAVRDGVDPAPEQWDVTSQAVRAAVMTGARVDGLDRAVARLIGVARQASVGSALPYQPHSGAEHHNAWVSMFGAQALELAGAGPAAMSWDQLV